MTDQMSIESQRSHIADRFKTLFNNPTLVCNVEWTADEAIVVDHGNAYTLFWLMEIGSDDDRYRFELWVNGADTGIYVEFAFPGEVL